jgi:hypothetical protein
MSLIVIMAYLLITFAIFNVILRFMSAGASFGFKCCQIVENYARICL